MRRKEIVADCLNAREDPSIGVGRLSSDPNGPRERIIRGYRDTTRSHVRIESVETKGRIRGAEAIRREHRVHLHSMVCESARVIRVAIEWVIRN